jgi:AcrR family transcriptional regulator
MPGQRATEAVRREQIIKAAYEVACRRGLASLTVRQVASKARLSAGLVLFHFKSKDHLIVALLDLLATTAIPHRPRHPAARPTARPAAGPLASGDECLAVIWIACSSSFGCSGRHAEVERMRAELARYREAFRPMVQQVLVAEPERFAHVTADGLAAVAVSFIKGCAVQSMIDPDRFDIQDYLAAAEALVGQFMASPAPRTA